MNEEEQKRKRFQIIANYLMLPFVLGVPPVVGWYIGSWLDNYFGISPYGMYGLLILGILSGIIEVYRTIKKYKDEDI